LACGYLTIANKLNERFSVKYGKGNHCKQETAEYSLMQDENLLNDELRRDCYYYNRRKEAIVTETDNNSESPLKQQSQTLSSCQNIHSQLVVKGLALQSLVEIDNTIK
jgi:hypothetical protein